MSLTDPARLREALDLSESTLRSLVDHAPDTIMIVDDERRILFVNHLEHGFTDDVLGKRAETFVAAEFRDTVINAIASVYETGVPTSYETDLMVPDGRIHHFETRVGPIILDGDVGRVSLVSTDITQRRQNERERVRLLEELQQSQKMDALGQLTGGVAHDFNNLLMAIGGNLELVLLDADLGRAATAHVEASLRAVDSAAELTRQLLVFSRKQSLVPRVADANELVREMLTILKRTLGETIEVEALLDPDLWHCEVDPVQLEHAILNLAVNARDAMSAGGRLQITTANVTIEGDEDNAAAEPGNYVVLSVIDDGSGMDADVAAQAFEPFYTTKETGKGTGLGLSTVYGFVAQSGGHAVLQSELAKGTTVRLLFPRADFVAVPEPESSPEPLIESMGGGLVLVVEDQKQVRDLSALMIERMGYQVVTANEGDEALALLADRDDIAVMFTDVGLPGGYNGFELAEAAATLRPLLPVVFTSGYADAVGQPPETTAHMKILGKPFPMADLAEALARAIEGDV